MIRSQGGFRALKITSRWATGLRGEKVAGLRLGVKVPLAPPLITGMLAPGKPCSKAELRRLRPVIANPINHQGSDMPLGLNLGLWMAAMGEGRVLFLDSVSGNDVNTGLSEAQAKRTYASLKAAHTLTGAKIRIARNSVLREQFDVPDGSLITVYGSGERPIVSGADVLPNASFSLAPARTNTYQISLPSIPTTNNPYVSVNNANVLQVWENNVRVGPTFGGQSSIAGVEANAGSWWWDASNKILYIHPSDSGNPISNGKTYEASVRTLAIHGGDGFTVEDLIGEKAGAASQTGQQGYGLLGYKSGTYRRCVGRRGWNHSAGVANSDNAGVLTFDTCEFGDHERQATTAASTAFVAYKAGTVQSTVVVKDCYVHMPTYSASYGDSGFYAHGSNIKVIWQGTNFTKNFRYGRQLVIDGGATSVHQVDDQLVAETCQYGDYVADTSGVTAVNVVAKGCTGAAVDARRQCTVTVRSIDCASGVNGFGQIGSPHVVSVPNAKIIRTNAPAVHTDGSGVAQSNAHATFLVTGSFFYRIGSIYCGASSNPDASGCNNNDISGAVRIYKDTLYTPSFSTDIAVWRTQSGEDAASAVTSNTPAPSDYDLPTWVGTLAT